VKIKKFLTDGMSVLLIAELIFTAISSISAAAEEKKLASISTNNTKSSNAEISIETNRFIVKYKDNNKREETINSISNRIEKIKKVKNNSNKSLDVITTKSKQKASDLMDQFKRSNVDSNIEYIQPDYEIKLSSNDTYFNDQWSLNAPISDMIDSQQNPWNNVISAWSESQGDGVTVAVIDTGIDINHEDLSSNIWFNPNEIAGNLLDDDEDGYIDDKYGWNFYEDNNIIYNNANKSNEQHGTHIAGIIAAEKDNNKGISGIAPKAKIMPLKVFNDGQAYTSDIIDAIAYAEKHGANIVNCSWGSTDDNGALKETIEESNMLFVCAAGNGGIDIDTTPYYPASYKSSNIIVVSSVDETGSLASTSNFGENTVDIAAPGENIISTLPEDSYGKKSGTSMAAGFMSGVASLLLSQDNSLSSIQLKEKIKNISGNISTSTNIINNKSNSNNNNLPISKQIKSTVTSNVYSEDSIDRFIVRYKDGQSEIGRKAVKAALSGEILSFETIYNYSFDVITINSKTKISDLFKKFSLYKANSSIKYIQPDYSINLISNDLSYEKVKNDLENTKTVQNSVYENVYGEVIIAVIDTAIGINNNTLKNKIWINNKESSINGADDDENGFIDDLNGWNFVNNTNNVYQQSSKDNDYHGTLISEIITNVAPRAKIMPLRVFENNIAYTSDIIRAIDYAEKNGASIVNCSWGTKQMNPALKEVIQNSSMLFICPAENNEETTGKFNMYPALYNINNIIPIKSSIDSFGKSNITTSVSDSVYTKHVGLTSSIAYATGVAALTKSKELGLTSKEIKSRMKLENLNTKIGNKYTENNKLNSVSQEVYSSSGSTNNLVEINNYYTLASINLDVTEDVHLECYITDQGMIYIPSATQIRLHFYYVWIDGGDEILYSAGGSYKIAPHDQDNWIDWEEGSSIEIYTYGLSEFCVDMIEYIGSPITDDYGYYFNNATEFNIGETISSQIDYGKDYDYFKFTTSTSGMYQIQINGDVCGKIIDLNGYEIGEYTGRAAIQLEGYTSYYLVILDNNSSYGINYNFKVTGPFSSLLVPTLKIEGDLLAWDFINGANGYDILDNGKLINVTDNKYVVGCTSYNEIHELKVRAYNENIVSYWSDTLTASIMFNNPRDPYGSCNTTNSSVTLDWPINRLLTEVQYMAVLIDPSTTPEKEIANSGWQKGNSSWTFDNLSLRPAEKYIAKVKAMYNNIQTEWFTTYVYSYAKTLTPMWINATNSSLTLNCDQSENPDNMEYNIRLSTSDYEDWNRNTYNNWHNSRIWTFEQLSPNTYYTADIQGKDEFGYCTEWVHCTGKYTLANKPANTDWKLCNYTNLILSWDGNNNSFNTQYYLKLTDSSTGLELFNSGWVSNINSYTFNGLEEEKEYRAFIKAKNNDNIETEWLDCGVHKTGTRTPTPMWSNVTNNSLTLLCDQSNNPDNMNYNIRLGTSDNEVWNKLSYNNWHSTKIWTFEQLSPNSYYTADIQGKDEFGYCTEWVHCTGKYTLANKPINPYWKVFNNTTLNLSWDNNNNPSGTHYYLKLTDSVTGTELANSGWISNINSYTFNELTEGKEYRAFVKAKNNENIETEWLDCGVKKPESVGLIGIYYDNPNFVGRVKAKIDSNINFNWGTTSPDSSINPGSFSIRWSGKIIPDYTESYTFYLSSNGGVRLWLDGQLLIDNMQNKSSAEFSKNINLCAGKDYYIIVEYSEPSTSAAVTLKWSSPSFSKEVIPSYYLRPIGTEFIHNANNQLEQIIINGKSKYRYIYDKNGSLIRREKI
jgi:Subtilisin-like serine proteases